MGQPTEKQYKHKFSYENKHESFRSLVFRVDNWIRLVGAGVVFLAITKRIPNSTITSEYFTAQSDVVLIVSGVLAMIVVPDLRKWLLSKFGGEA